MKIIRIVLACVLAVVIFGLAYLLYDNFKKDIDFDSEYNTRRDACAQKLKVIRALEEAYMKTYHVYCGDFDTLINRLMTEDSLLVQKEKYDTTAILKAGLTVHEVLNMSSDEQKEKKFVVVETTYGKALDEARADKNNKDLIINDPATGVQRPITDEEIRNCRYVPGYGKSKEFNLKTKNNNTCFMAWINFKDLFDDAYNSEKYQGLNTVRIDTVLLNNKIAAINEKSKKLLEQNPDSDPIYTSWRVGDTLKPETRGNFE